MNKSIILLSGGLDSLVCLGLCKEEYNVELALTFNYGQKSAEKEIAAAAELCKYYGITHKIIKLDWLKEMTHNALTGNNELPHGLDNPEASAKAVWVPNRNGLFLNIAGAFADAENYTHIIIGANKEEAATFPDNTKEFAESINTEFQYSTQAKPQVLVPLINYDKNDIVRLALEKEMPLELVQSCYDTGSGHCGKCESCCRLKNALKNNGAAKYLKQLFNE
ncbi:7-cyano-7-deazaguanine synthase QueC [bacterium]|nr:7-cyano-7-deazaguanine synthase QueC [bacterium]